MLSDDIRQVLLADWDPCAIGENPKLRDEYDQFISEIEEAIRALKGPDFLAALLQRIEGEMHAPIDDLVRRVAAEKLAALRPS